MTPEIDCLITEPRWEAFGLETLAHQSLDAVLKHFNLSALQVELSILGCNGERIAELNATHRQKPTPTNILSWPRIWHERPLGTMPDLSRARPPELGDLAIAYDICAKEADIADIAFKDHLRHLLVHGILHLLGFDHENDLDYAIMQQTEREILARMCVSDPYLSNRKTS